MRWCGEEKSRTQILGLSPAADQIGDYPVQRILLTSRQVATALGIKERTLKYWTATKRGRRPRLNFVKLGKAKRFELLDVLQFIDRLKVRSRDENKLAA